MQYIAFNINWTKTAKHQNQDSKAANFNQVLSIFGFSSDIRSLKGRHFRPSFDKTVRMIRPIDQKLYFRSPGKSQSNSFVYLPR